MQKIRHVRMAMILMLGLTLLLSACGKNGPAMVIDKTKSYKAIVTTTKGNFTIELFAKDAPITVNNFVVLSRDKFYEGIPFHRIVKDFVIQTGDPNGDGTGGPGYKFKDEKTNYKYEPGIVAMANAGPNTNGSQFFICSGEECSILNQQPNYTIFGKVVEGMDVVAKIAATPVDFNLRSREFDKPKEIVAIQTIEIVEQ